MATASAVTNYFSQPGVLMDENYADVLDARFKFVKRRVWGQPIQGLKYWTVESTSRAYEKHSYVASGGIVPKNRDVDNMPLMHLIPGFDNTYTPETYRLGIRIERRLRETDQFRVIDKMMEDLNQAGRDTIELYAALPFNTAFAATVAWTCADGMNLVDSARPQEGAGLATWSNLETTGALSQARIATMRLNFRKNLNEAGRKRPIVMKKVIIPADLEDTAISEMMSVLKPGSSLNDTNILTRYGLSYEVWDYLTSTTAWFGQGDGAHELFWYWGVRPGVEAYDTGNPDVYARRIRMAFVTGADRPSNVRGNAGA